MMCSSNIITLNENADIYSGALQCGLMGTWIPITENGTGTGACLLGFTAIDLCALAMLSLSSAHIKILTCYDNPGYYIVVAII